MLVFCLYFQTLSGHWIQNACNCFYLMNLNISLYDGRWRGFNKRCHECWPPFVQSIGFGRQKVWIGFLLHIWFQIAFNCFLMDLIISLYDGCWCCFNKRCHECWTKQLLSNQLVLVGKKFELGSSQCATEKLVRHCPEESVWSERLIWSLNFMIPVLVWLT